MGIGRLRVSQKAPVKSINRYQRQGPCRCVQVEYWLWCQKRALQDGLQPFCPMRSQKSFLKCPLTAAVGGRGQEGQHTLPSCVGRSADLTPTDVTTEARARKAALPSVRWFCICLGFVGGFWCGVPAPPAQPPPDRGRAEQLAAPGGG